MSSAAGQDLGPLTVDVVSDLYLNAHDVAIDKFDGVHFVFAHGVTLSGNRERLRIELSSRVRPDRQWIEEIVADVDTDFLRVSLAVDGDGNPVVAFIADDGLFVVTRDSEDVWGSPVPVDPDADALILADVDLHYVPQTGSLVMAYTRGGGGLGLASKSPGGSWVSDAIGDVGWQPSMIPPAGFFGFGKVAVYDRDQGNLLIVEQMFEDFTPVWRTRTVSSTNDSGGSPSMRQLPDGKVGIAFQRRNGTTHSIFYAETSNSLWDIREIDAGDAEEEKGGSLSMTLDAQQEPQIIYSVDEIETGIKSFVMARRHPRLGWVKRPFDSLAPGRYGGLDSECNSVGEPITIDCVDQRIRATLHSSESWVISTPEDTLPAGPAFMPVVATAPDGSKRVAFCAPSPFSGTRIYYGTLSGDGEYDVSFIASVAVRPYDIEIVIAPDGTERVFALRRGGVFEYVIEDGTFAGSGQLPDSMSEHSPAGDLAAAAGTDGTLHVCFSSPDGEDLLHARQKPGQEWEYITYPGETRPGTRSLAVAVSASGQAGVSGWSDDMGGLTFSRVLPDGIVGGTIQLALEETQPPNTAIAWQEEVATILWESGGQIWSRIGVNSSPNSPIADVFPNAVVAIRSRNCTEFDVAYFSYGSRGSEFASGKYSGEGGLFEPHGLVTFPIPTGVFPKFNLAIDGFGLPCAALGIHLNEVNDTALFLTPSDALDPDNDGLPILYEDAYCLHGVNRVDAAALLPSWDAFTFDAEGTLTMPGIFQVPDGFATLLPGERGVLASEFCYGLEVNGDLGCWVDLETFLEGRPAFLGLSQSFGWRGDLGGGVTGFDFSIRASEFAQGSLERFFVRPTVKRIRARWQ